MDINSFKKTNHIDVTLKKYFHVIPEALGNVYVVRETESINTSK